MRVSEWILIGYFAYLVVLAAVLPLSRGRRIGVVATGLPLIAMLAIGASLPASPTLRFVRIWLPAPCLLLGYWMSGLFFVSPQEQMEARFLAFDRRVRGWLGVIDAATTAPRVVLEFFESAYFTCYAVLPAGMLVLSLSGHEDVADRYWSIVLLAELACFATQPWLRTRPSWVLNPNSPVEHRRVAMRQLNLAVARHMSTRANTFPSGHAAGAFAVALAVGHVWPAAGFVFLLIALSIAAGSVMGEYHYAGDAIAGAATALAAWGIIMLVGV